MRSGHRSGKSSSATKETDPAIWAQIALSLAPERAIIAGTSCSLSASLSAKAIGYPSYPWGQSKVKPIETQTHIVYPPKLHYAFKVHTSREAHGAIGWHLGQIVGGGRQSRLSTVGLERGFCLKAQRVL